MEKVVMVPGGTEYRPSSLSARVKRSSFETEETSSSRSSSVGQKQGLDNPLGYKKYDKMKELESTSSDYLPHRDKQHHAEKSGESVSKPTNCKVLIDEDKAFFRSTDIRYRNKKPVEKGDDSLIPLNEELSVKETVPTVLPSLQLIPDEELCCHE